MNAYANNLRNIAAMERKQGRDELGMILESAADEIDRLQAILPDQTPTKGYERIARLGERGKLVRKTT